jgi:hypothetical protein
MITLYIIIIAYLFVGLVLVGTDKRWGIPYSIIGEPPDDMYKVFVVFWPLALIAVLIGIIFNGFRWQKGAK